MSVHKPHAETASFNLLSINTLPELHFCGEGWQLSRCGHNSWEFERSCGSPSSLCRKSWKICNTMLRRLNHIDRLMCQTKESDQGVCHMSLSNESDSFFSNCRKSLHPLPELPTNVALAGTWKIGILRNMSAGDCGACYTCHRRQARHTCQACLTNHWCHTTLCHPFPSKILACTQL
jgi:hypothetical protein